VNEEFIHHAFNFGIEDLNIVLYLFGIILGEDFPFDFHETDQTKLKSWLNENADVCFFLLCC
jgi:hypothetical protein